MKRLHYEVVDSTNVQARRLAAQHPGERLLVTAATQTAGRGRHGRVWQSPLGGAWMSIVWPVRQPPRGYAATSLVVAVAVRRALQETAGDELADLRIKWPNDLLLADRKVAGILCEQCPSMGSRDGFIIIGIGVNANFAPGSLAAGLRYPATTLSTSLGRSLDLETLITAVAARVTEAMETFEREGLSDPLLAELRSNLAYIGSVRTWLSPRGSVTGRVSGVDAAGRLLLECRGEEIACEVGELVGEDADQPA